MSAEIVGEDCEVFTDMEYGGHEHNISFAPTSSMISVAQSSKHTHTRD